MTDPPWLDWGRRLAAIAQNGLEFSEAGDWDHQRYQQVQAVAVELLASGFADLDPVRVRAMLDGEEGYATTKVDVRGVVARGSGVLFVRERSDGCWTLPGGWADPWDVPSAAVEREVREEAGIDARASKLLACLDRSSHGHVPPHPFRVYKLFFLMEESRRGEAFASPDGLTGEARERRPSESRRGEAFASPDGLTEEAHASARADGFETDEVGWFPLDAVPPLSLGRIMPGQLDVVAAHLADPARPTDFD